MNYPDRYLREIKWRVRGDEKGREERPGIKIDVGMFTQGIIGTFRRVESVNDGGWVF